MSTPLGPKGSLRLHGKNVGTNTIEKGTAGQMVPSATLPTYYEDSIQEDVIPVQAFSVSNDHYIGVAVDDVPPGAVGEFVHIGWTQVKSAEAIAVGQEIEPSDTLNAGFLGTTVGGLGAPTGIALEAASGAGELIKAVSSGFAFDPGIGGTT